MKLDLTQTRKSERVPFAVMSGRWCRDLIWNPGHASKSGAGLPSGAGDAHHRTSDKLALHHLDLGTWVPNTGGIRASTLIGDLPAHTPVMYQANRNCASCCKDVFKPEQREGCMGRTKSSSTAGASDTAGYCMQSVLSYRVNSPLHRLASTHVAADRRCSTRCRVGKLDDDLWVAGLRGSSMGQW